VASKARKINLYHLAIKWITHKLIIIMIVYTSNSSRIHTLRTWL